MQEMINNAEQSEQGITIFGKKPSEILSAFHNSGLAKQGYAISGKNST